MYSVYLLVYPYAVNTQSLLICISYLNITILQLQNITIALMAVVSIDLRGSAAGGNWCSLEIESLIQAQVCLSSRQAGRPRLAAERLEFDLNSRPILSQCSTLIERCSTAVANTMRVWNGVNDPCTSSLPLPTKEDLSPTYQAVVSAGPGVSISANGLQTWSKPIKWAIFSLSPQPVADKYTCCTTLVRPRHSVVPTPALSVKNRRLGRISQRGSGSARRERRCCYWCHHSAATPRKETAPLINTKRPLTNKTWPDLSTNTWQII